MLKWDGGKRCEWDGGQFRSEIGERPNVERDTSEQQN